MTGHQEFLNLLNEYSAKNNYSVPLISNLYETSKDGSKDISNPRHFKTKYTDLDVISMDAFARFVLTPIYCNASTEKYNALASFDAFVIDKNGIWNFIEFKNQKVKSTKEKCIEKVFANLYWLFGVLFQMRKNGKIIDFDYDNPVDFVKNRCKFILVIGDGIDDLNIDKIRNAKKIKYEKDEQLNFIQKFQCYIFNDANVYTETMFDDIFVKNFQY